MKKRYDLSKIMKRAWVIYRANNHKLSWSDSLKQSWNIAKNGVKRISFTDLYNKYYNDVVNYVMSRIGNRETAEEIVNDVFIRINKSYIDNGRYDVNKASFKTLLFNIVKNAIIDYWRKKKMNLAHIDGYTNDNGISSFDFVSKDSNELEQAELHEQVMFALNKLKENEKNVVKMFYLDNYKQKEISEILGLSLTNVKQIIYRTKDKLQVLLKNAYSIME